MPDALFDMLDLDGDGLLSRPELNVAARRFGWSWREAPVFALLDLLSIPDPIPREKFVRLIHEIEKDPLGPYGNVLLNASHFSLRISPKKDRISHKPTTVAGDPKKKRPRTGPMLDDTIRVLEQNAGVDAAGRFRSLIATLETIHVPADESALLIIDPQRSFTEGAWMQSIGGGAQADVAPIRLAFGRCYQLLSRCYGRMETMFTRCPFPVDSYGWDDRLSDIIDGDQLYFIKPGNSVLFPPTNGFGQWVDRCIDSGKKTLVMGGCTLNSCVRVSSMDTREKFKHLSLEVVVDLSISGARSGNYIPSPRFSGQSAVEFAVRQMLASGVRVVRHVDWR